MKQIQSQKSNPSNKDSNMQVNKMISDIEFSPSTSINTNFGQTSTTFNHSPSTSSFVSKNEEIIQNFMLMTNMNRDFSEKCLQENNFEIGKSYEVFKSLQSLNAVPPEAFIK